MTAEIRRALTPYLDLFREFVERRLEAPDFEVRFLKAYLSDDTLWEPALFDILDGVFADVDEYVHDDDLRRRPGGLDTAELLVRVAQALAELDALATP